MSNLLILSGKDVRPSGILLQTRPFKDLWQRSKHEPDDLCLSEFAYIYYKADWKSEYNNYGLEKDAQLGEDLFGDRNYEPDELILQCIEKYKELQRTPSLVLIESTRMAVNSIQYYFQEITITNSDTDIQKKEKLNKFDLRKISDSMKSIDSWVDTLNRLEDKVMKEEKDMIVKIRGGGNVGIFEEEAPWIKK